MDDEAEGDDDFSGVFNPISESDIAFRPKRPKELQDYYVGAVLGKGSFGKVKEAVHVKTRKLYAIKIMKERRLKKTPGGIEAVQREIELWQTLEHPCIVQMFDHFAIEVKEKIYIVMEYVGCGNLHDLVTRSFTKRLPIPQARCFFRDLLDGVSYIHSIGIIHKDIKPANCLISSEARLKICDFGVAERKDDIPLARRASTVNAVGSPAFQPPEIASGEEKMPDYAVDIWAVGITLFFMVCGQYPFQGETVLVLLENIAQGNWELPSFVDEVTKNLVSSILKVNKSKRSSLAEIQNHEWMQVDDEEYLTSHLKQSRKKKGKGEEKGEKSKKDEKKKKGEEEGDWVELTLSPSMLERDSKGLIKLYFLEEDDDFDRERVPKRSDGGCCAVS
mmetsp:Transcript_36592/g.50325  ORF Transcript_36592/g.50325 Transcript_36592/m.50325 type:complete len:390 (-) Transcript_36592:59-1228(-)|eukprot:CAMPEP_0201492130 /NCGR_PEP_ID=MMETSP0151_2-20130828/32091_1 /ASSEMBLY_ACC=CAM_ASM_000257 /TAXON_ID=200890 /ORGANISM="Paramoeba atlantica, Strain 621/1 / CCAP 1560/9" /LENGTH=389 /DNA_ID=CAMNT_0047878797 /DNA_START=256 /DNA_END=1425 /DNA_ORIENTATION=+